MMTTRSASCMGNTTCRNNLHLIVLRLPSGRGAGHGSLPRAVGVAVCRLIFPNARMATSSRPAEMPQLSAGFTSGTCTRFLFRCSRCNIPMKRSRSCLASPTPIVCFFVSKPLNRSPPMLDTIVCVSRLMAARGTEICIEISNEQGRTKPKNATKTMRRVKSMRAVLASLIASRCFSMGAMTSLTETVATRQYRLPKVGRRMNMVPSTSDSLGQAALPDESRAFPNPTPTEDVVLGSSSTMGSGFHSGDAAMAPELWW
mmetsp:Transcript_108927/g.314570  ORF Transcript_108927/g.314570 Transcript_108927/m.314570 type:complete len:258 (+) Transcript_108927:661-1434(+)